jgi:hypothetical protein
VTTLLPRWLLVIDARARQMLRWIPVAGLAGRSAAGVALTERFVRLLGQPLIPSALPAD